MPVDIKQLLNAAGGEIVGKVRLQKTVYLLDQVGMDSGFSYEYHHYGPYSAELAKTVDEEVVSHKIDEEVRRRADGVPYSVFRLRHESGGSEASSVLGLLSFDRAREALAVMQQRDATVLELASTIHWLTSVEHLEDWRGELARRKGIKASTGRVERAVDLLKDIGLRVSL